MAKRGVNREETEALIPEIVPSRDIDQDLEKNATPTKAFARHSGSKIETAFASKPLRTGMLAVSVLVIIAQASYINSIEGPSENVIPDATNACFTAIFCGVIGLIFAHQKVRSVLSKPEGNARMKEIATAIQEGAYAFLNQEYKWLFVFGVGAAIFLSVGIGQATTGFCFVVGAVISGGEP